MTTRHSLHLPPFFRVVLDLLLGLELVILQLNLHIHSDARIYRLGGFALVVTVARLGVLVERDFLIGVADRGHELVLLLLLALRSAVSGARIDRVDDILRREGARLRIAKEEPAELDEDGHHHGRIVDEEANATLSDCPLGHEGAGIQILEDERGSEDGGDRHEDSGSEKERDDDFPVERHGGLDEDWKRDADEVDVRRNVEDQDDDMLGKSLGTTRFGRDSSQ